MKQFNLHATSTKTNKLTAYQHYALVLSALIIGLSLYTYYTMYLLNKQAQHIPTQEPEMSAPAPKSALHHFVHILEYLPKELVLTNITVTQATISLRGVLKNKHSLSSFLKQIAPHYTIMQAKTAESSPEKNIVFTVELKTV